MNTQPTSLCSLLKASWEHLQSKRMLLTPGILGFAVIVSLLQVGVVSVQMPVAIGILSLVAGIIGMFAYLYILLAVARPYTSYNDVLVASVPRLFPFIGMSLLVGLYSLGWIAAVGMLIVTVSIASNVSLFVPVGFLLIILGFVASLVYGPRYSLAIIVWLVEDIGVSASIQRSYTVTRGYWGKVVGNLIVAGMLGLLFMIPVAIFAVIISGIGDAIAGSALGVFLSTFLMTLFTYAYHTFLASFMLKLTATLISYPIESSQAVAMPAPKPAKAVAPTPKATVKKVTKKAKA